MKLSVVWHSVLLQHSPIPANHMIQKMKKRVKRIMLHVFENVDGCRRDWPGGMTCGAVMLV